MNTQHSFRWLWPALAIVCLTVPFFADRAMTQPQEAAANANVKTAGGLTVVTFIVDPGTIKVNLPDDTRAGDTISGTVFTEPKGDTSEEKAKNQNILDSYVLDVEGTKIQAGRATFAWLPAVPQPGAPPRYVIKIVEVLGRPIDQIPNPGAFIFPNPGLTPLGVTQSGAVVTPDPKIPSSFNIPPLGQTGRPIVITGPFDGNSSNTDLRGTALRSSVQDFEKNTENVSGGFGLIAESPRKAVFQAPTNATGPIEVNLKEGNVETKGIYRNVGVNLSAPKTDLLKGEKTTLTVQVNGLEGIKQPVPLTLECTGVITMEGGTYQPLMIQPSQVGAGGRYTTTRGITGVQAGGWGATATVVTSRFNVSLQDDTAPHRRILWNTVTGEYIFNWPGGWPPKGRQGGAGGTTGESGGKTESGATIEPADPNLPPTDPPTGPSGTGTIKMRPCILVLTHNAPDRRVFARLDTCTNSGTATIEDPKTKVKSTITDRNTADNSGGVQ